MRAGRFQASELIKEEGFRKDKSLDRLAELANVAQFVSFSPGSFGKQEFSRVRGFAANYAFRQPQDAIAELLARSPDKSVNVRSFTPESPRSNEFLYGLKRSDEVLSALNRFRSEGLYSIINETVDVKDGGVSGVFQGGAVEFAPDDTPRCVESPGVASLPVSLGQIVLATVYGFEVEPGIGPDYRLEFSIHPKPRGWKDTHLLGWELEFVGTNQIHPSMGWPNRFSRHIGDKAYGLLIASALGLPVPETTVIGRRVAPFTFGQDTGSFETWIRTSPTEQVPGKFTTKRGWTDPFALLMREDPAGNQISSVLAQRAVKSCFSGALIVGQGGDPIVEGKVGEGEELMRGTVLPEPLPPEIVRDVITLFERTTTLLGAVRFEWVHDGRSAWIVQLHRGSTQTSVSAIVPGEATNWHRFEVGRGLESLRTFLSKMSPEDGVILEGQIGLTSHVADVVRKAGRPARIEAGRGK